MGHVGHFELTHITHPSIGTPLDAYGPLDEGRMVQVDHYETCHTSTTI